MTLMDAGTTEARRCFFNAQMLIIRLVILGYFYHQTENETL